MNEPRANQPSNEEAGASMIPDDKAVANKKQNQWTMKLIIIVALAPITLAYLMYFTGVGVPDNTVNNGVLLQTPVRLPEILEGDNIEVQQRIEAQKKWRLFIPVYADCNEACQAILFTTRQVHIRLADKSERLERYAVNLNGQQGVSLLDDLAAEHPRMKAVNIEQDVWEAWLKASGTAFDYQREPYYLLVDQEGLAMMYYTADIHGNLLLKDIKRALKYSIDYQ